jgi:hypothetical protein
MRCRDTSAACRRIAANALAPLTQRRADRARSTDRKEPCRSHRRLVRRQLRRLYV